MTPNVFIKHYQRGKLVEERAVHNTWTRGGHQYLAQMMASLSYVPFTHERDERLKYLGLGIGGKYRDALATLPPLSVSYPAVPPGAGNTYDCDSPELPLIDTLELPVRVSGGSNPYSSAPPTDVWLVGPPALYVTHPVETSSVPLHSGVNVHAVVDCTAADYVYGPFTVMPVTEAGLFTDAATPASAYGSLVAYVNFGTIMLDPTSTVEFVWQVRFS